jgi:O-antigen ligase
MGSFVSRLLPVLIGISYLLNLNFRNRLNIILLAISAALVVLSGERLSFFYFFVTLIFFFIVEFNKKNLLLFFTIIIFTTLIFFINPNSYKRIFIHTYNQVKESNKIIGFSQRHLMHYFTAYEMFLEKKLLGHGLKSFRYLCGEDKYIQEIIKKNKKYEVVAKEDGYVQLRQIIYSKPNRFIYIIYKDNTEEVYLYKHNYFWYQKKKKLYHETEIEWDASYFVEENKNYYAGPKYNFKKGEALFINYDLGDRCNTHPHNIYMQFLSETGIIGFLFFFTMFCYVVFNLSKIFLKVVSDSFVEKIEKSKFFILLSIFLAMFPFLPSGSYFNNWILIISYLPVGIYLFLSKKT